MNSLISATALLCMFFFLSQHEAVHGQRLEDTHNDIINGFNGKSPVIFYRYILLTAVAGTV